MEQLGGLLIEREVLGENIPPVFWSLGIALGGTRRVGGPLGVAGRLSGTVSLETAGWGSDVEQELASDLLPGLCQAVLPGKVPPRLG